MEKILIPLLDNDVAPRFDLATDVLVVTIPRASSRRESLEEKVVVLDHASAESICRLAISENVNTVICAGIEGKYYDFLQWKGATVIDDVCGPVDAVLDAYHDKRLAPGSSLY
jgi:predicted Fe-Mo cluster-binding NifX family protein